jgi:Protein of unknown function (DUF2752)
MTAATTVALGGPRARPVAAGVVAASVAWTVAPIHPTVSCPFRALTGLPCPLCGMTRAVTSALRGDLVASLHYQPAGLLLLALIALLVVRRARTPLVLPAWALYGALAAMWAWNLTLNPTFH